MSESKPRTYGHGFSVRKEDPKRCIATVYEPGLGFHSYQCRKPRKYGDYCGTHDPERIAARAARRGPSKWEREAEQQARLSKLAQLGEATLEILENRPHGGWTGHTSKLIHDEARRLGLLGEKESQ